MTDPLAVQVSIVHDVVLLVPLPIFICDILTPILIRMSIMLYIVALTDG